MPFFLSKYFTPRHSPRTPNHLPDPNLMENRLPGGVRSNQHVLTIKMDAGTRVASILSTKHPSVVNRSGGYGRLTRPPPLKYFSVKVDERTGEAAQMVDIVIVVVNIEVFVDVSFSRLLYHFVLSVRK